MPFHFHISNTTKRTLRHSAFTHLLLLLAIPAAACAEDVRKVVIPFDFVSKFDGGRYGRLVGEMFWKKLTRNPQFIVPESMLDVRQYCEAHHLDPSPETDQATMQKIVCNDFDANIAIWGSVERVAGTESDEYDIVIKCVDFSEKPNPRVIADIKARTKTVSEIPHLYAKQTLDALYGWEPEGPAAPNSIAEENWPKNPNLVIGDFENAINGMPYGWEKVCGQQREPFGRLVQWLTESENPNKHVIRFILDKNMAENEGLMYYSDPFPVDENATYRFQCRWRSNGPAVKVFIKCYDEENTPYQPDSPGSNKSRSKGLKKGDYVPESKERREVYRSQQNLSNGPVNTWSWQTHTEDFTPKHVKYSPNCGRIMLYAYLAPGEVEFDDVVVKQILPASPGEAVKIRRHSHESPITIEEMEENERRSRDAKEKGRE